MLALALLPTTFACGFADEGETEDPHDHAFPPIVNTQAPGDEPNTPQEAAEAFTAPEGFEVTLFAGEPDVAQPIAMTFDDRGRLWVAECFTYTSREFDVEHGDRVTIFEDTDGDGAHDKRTVFWDRGFMLTGLEYGFGGLWTLNNGTLSFIADENGDDVPDAEPVAMLDGFTFDAGHNVVNGLAWGPDGWLYGRHGITATSNVGVPGASDEDRTLLNCGIWRFHPTRHTFEVVATGTTNPWGLDWNEYGDAFFTNNVIGHAWHLIPGAHYRRMFGQDFNPHVYGLIDQHADHYHWDESGNWTASRPGEGKANAADSLGGGHSHSGGMIYQGDNWPEEYRGDLYMCNTHGKRINRDALVPHGSGYKITHQPDFAFANSPWFKGVELKSGPDGGVFLLDWTDLGECHDHDGVHRNSGRIYKITYGKPERAGDAVDLAALPLGDLMVMATTHPNVWHRRHAARLLIEPTGPDGGGRFGVAQAERVRKEQLLRALMPPDGPSGFQTLRATRLLVAACGVDPNSLDLPGGTERAAARSLVLLLGSDDHRQRAAEPVLRAELEAVFPSINATVLELTIEQLALPPTLVEQMRNAPAWRPLVNRAADDDLRMQLAVLSVACRRSPEVGLRTAIAVGGTATNADDHNLPLMAWYAAETGVAEIPMGGVLLASVTKIPLLREYATRRIASELPSEPHAAALGVLLERATVSTRSVSEGPRAQPAPPAAAPSLTLRVGEDAVGFQRDVLTGTLAALEGRRKVTPPAAWADVQPVFAASEDAEVRSLAQKLAVIFGDGAALEELRAIVANRDLPDETRVAAIESLAEARDEAVVPVLLDLLTKLRGQDRNLFAPASRALGAFDSPEAAAVLINALPRVRLEEQDAVLSALVSRPSYAGGLTGALVDGRVPIEMLSAEHVRSLRAFKNPKIDAVLDDLWGTSRATPAEKLAEIAAWTAKLEDGTEADPIAGRAVYQQSCGRCHKLYGDGGELGPNLTGSDRKNLDYLLGNVFDPSAVVPAAWRVSTVLLQDGRVLTGVVTEQGGETLSIATADDTITVPTGDVLEIEPGDASLMPEGLFKTLTEQQVRNLIAYLRSDRAVD
ncbi:PVC-type heme-binding CxxCH protein [Alienimonas chondri]|uniref:PVC-type heme-binding CxxCH protein n=1 Tax=Alienimonas chondri TaxID=2681879 RepID=UPI0014893BF3|nr:PVC-type heme-binding CxxCH protein [Alienimonas chondri]